MLYQMNINNLFMRYKNKEVSMIIYQRKEWKIQGLER
jgi:hypothetical protein